MPGLLPIILASLFTVPAVLGIVYWSIVAFRVWRIRADPPTVREGEGLSGPASWPRVSIIVPAHDEERVIDECAESLRKLDYDDLEIVFVLDRCTDGTVEIVRRHAADDDRIVVIENDHCPAGWAGKCHAAHRGAGAATGDYLLFTDADTQFDRNLVRATVALADARDVALLSLLSTLTTEHAFERVAQPVASLKLVGMYPIKKIGDRSTRARPFANGQFMLFRRSSYDAIGGHESVQDDLLEDIAFARRIDDAGDRVAVLLADGMLECSMYDSLESFQTGWKRIFIEACKRKPARLRKNAWRVIAVGVALPATQLALLALGIGLAIGGLSPLYWPGFVLTPLIGWGVQGASLAVTYRMGGTPARYAILYPIGCAIIARIMLQGASDLKHRRPVRWAGREYVLEPR